MPWRSSQDIPWSIIGRLLPWIWRLWGIGRPFRRLRRPGDVPKSLTLLQVLRGHDFNGKVLSPGILLLLSSGVVSLPPLLYLGPFFFHISQGVSFRAPPLGAPSHVSPPVLPSHISATLAASQPLHGSAHTVDPVELPALPISFRLVPSVVGESCCSSIPCCVLHQAWLCTLALSSSEV